MVLASASPRRRELLAQIVPKFDVVAADVDEEALATPDPFVTATRTAQAKARKVYRLRPDALVIAADTVVALKDDERWTQLAKPVDEADAQRMLALLSGREHFVITGYCLMSEAGEAANWAATSVRFRTLSQDEIRAYVSTGEPMDKAGGYAIQGGAKDFVEWIDGSWSNVVGLPLEELKPVLDQALAGT